MHTTALRSDAFSITVDGRPATIEDVFGGFDEHDRLGIVIASDGGAAGAGSLILAAVTAFYDRLRATGEPFFAYADFFAFLVPEGPAGVPDLARETRHSAIRRIRSALVYSPSGQTAHADVLVRGSAQSDAFIDAMLAAVTAGGMASAQVQSFRRLGLDEALGMLPTARG